MSPLLLIGLVAVGGGALLLASKTEGSGKKGLPTDSRFQVVQWKAGLGRDYNGVAYIFDGKPVGADDKHAAAAVAYIRPKLEARKAKLPANANSWAGDQYSNEAYWFPYPQTMAGFAAPGAVSTSIVIDEHGRTYDLDYGQAGMLQNLWANPLFRAAVFAALAASGYGVAGYAALQAYQLRGSDMSLKNMALTAARSYVVSQCGPACGAAFDFGVGVASGKKADEAAIDAATSNMTPEQRAAFNEGKKALKELR